VHTSNLTYGVFVIAVVVTLAAQITSYYSTAVEQQPTKQGKIGFWALCLEIFSMLLLATAAYMADTDWSALPKSPKETR
jgi:hypothetical protein